MSDNFYIALTAWGIWASVAMALAALRKQIRAAKELTALQTFLQLAATWESDQMHRKRAQLARTLLANRHAMDLDDSVLVFFETLAHMIRRGIVDRELTWDTFRVDLCGYWSAVEHYARRVRIDLLDPLLFAGMEELSKEFCSGRPRSSASKNGVMLTDSAIIHFLEWESRRAVLD